MSNIKERPACHRGEDLVSYLYGEANASDAHDFAEHMKRCDACRTEFRTFSHVHDSILQWRNESLGFGSLRDGAAGMTHEVAVSYQLEHRSPKRSARAAIREFFAMSPLWLRGATALATLLLFALAVIVISRMWTGKNQLATGNPEKVFTAVDFNNAVNKEIEARMNTLKSSQTQTNQNQTVGPVPVAVAPSKQRRTPSTRIQRTRLTPQERQQLAADLRLISGRDDDLPFVFSEEPEQ